MRTIRSTTLVSPSRLHSRRDFLIRTAAASLVLGTGTAVRARAEAEQVRPDYTLRIGTSLVELGPDRIVSTTIYNGQFPGPLLRFKEGQRVVVDIHNDTDTPELVHWHGQMIPSNVDGAAEEGSPFVPAHGMQRIAFGPRPAGFRFIIPTWWPQRRGERLQSLDHQRRGVLDADDDADLYPAAGTPLPAQVPQRQR